MPRKASITAIFGLWPAIQREPITRWPSRYKGGAPEVSLYRRTTLGPIASMKGTPTSFNKIPQVKLSNADGQIVVIANWIGDIICKRQRFTRHRNLATRLCEPWVAA